LLGGLVAAPVIAAGGTIFATSRRKGNYSLDAKLQFL
jgi:hypothetical protein